MTHRAFDDALRAAAFARVVELQRDHGDEIPWSAIARGFQLGGRQMYLASKAEGIYVPKGHELALSVKTVVPRPGREQPYRDELASDSGSFRYAYKARGGPDARANRALRLAMSEIRPLIYFWAVAPAVYTALAPVFVTRDDRWTQYFEVTPGDTLAGSRTRFSAESILSDTPAKRYVMRTVRQRLHQHRFRHLVLDAYQHQCAMCSIHFDELLEAAHILPDADERGHPEVRNGLALCTTAHLTATSSTSQMTTGLCSAPPCCGGATDPSSSAPSWSATSNASTCLGTKAPCPGWTTSVRGGRRGRWGSGRGLDGASRLLRRGRLGERVAVGSASDVALH